MNAHETYQVMASMTTHNRDLSVLARRRSVDDRRAGTGLLRRARRQVRG